MDKEKIRIFISGTQDDMKPERDAVEKAINATKIATGVRAETTVSQSKPPRSWIEQQILDCNIYVGVYSHRYGWIIPEENISATEFEYDFATKLGKPILIWIRKEHDEEKDYSDYDRQLQFLSRVSDFTKGYFRQTFNNLADLKTWVSQALREIYVEIIRQSTESNASKVFSLVAPSGNDIQLIKDNFSRITSRSLRRIQTIIPGMKDPFPRDEISHIEKQFLEFKAIVLTGDAGTGKSGIAAMIARNSRNNGKVTLLIDAREISTAKSEREISTILELADSLSSVIKRVCNNGCRVIIDQLDNIAGYQSAKLIVELIQELTEEVDNIELMAVCRNKEPHEQDLLKGFLSSGLKELICNQINQEQVINILASIGINNYSREVLDFGRNLLNLELIGQIHAQQPDFNFSKLTDEVFLWEKYIDIWCSREGRDVGEEMFTYAAGLAKVGLNHPDGLFEKNLPTPITLQRLVSSGIITHIDGRMYRFRHEKFQDFIYAQDSADKMRLPQDILLEIPEHKTYNVFKWVDSIYTHRNSPMRLKFFEEVFNVQ